MSLTVTNQKSEREQIVALRRQAVFMFIATHLDTDGCFSDSDTYIANTVAGCNRQSVSRARQSLEATGDVMVIETDRHDAKGRNLPNKVRPAPVATFWVREWFRQESKAESREHGENASEWARVNPSKDAGLTQKTGAPVGTVKTRAHEHNNQVSLKESPSSKSVSSLEREKREDSVTSSREHGEKSIAYTLDKPVKQALAALRDKLARLKTQLSMYASDARGEKPEGYRAEVRDIEAQIATLEGRQ